MSITLMNCTCLDLIEYQIEVKWSEAHILIAIIMFKYCSSLKENCAKSITFHGTDNSSRPKSIQFNYLLKWLKLWTEFKENTVYESLSERWINCCFSHDIMLSVQLRGWKRVFSSLVSFYVSFFCDCIRLITAPTEDFVSLDCTSIDDIQMNF